MKKALSLLFALLLIILTFVGCGDKKEEEPIIIPTVGQTVPETQPAIDDTPSPVDQTFFENTFFVGDSISVGLQNYAMYERNLGNECLGNAEFLCSGSLSFFNALWDKDDPNNVHPYYNGTQYTVPEAIEVLQPDKLFIKLGTNDLGLSGVEGTMEDANELFDLIVAANPDIQIFIQAVTPILASGETGSLTNENIRLLNTELEKLADEKGWRFIDVYTPLADENGYLIYDYCGDPEGMGIHIMGDGYKVWVDAIMQSAG